ncbi:MAG: ATP-dependent nuclease [Gemmatimonadales bacterium]
MEFEGLQPLSDLLAEGRSAAHRAAELIRSAAAGVDAVATAVNALIAAVSSTTWSGPLAETAAVQAASTEASIAVPAKAAQALTEVDRVGRALQTDTAAAKNAEAWLLQAMPVFVYLEEWEAVPGQYDVQAYLRRAQNPGEGTPDDRVRDRMFEKLLKVADLNADELNRLLASEHQERLLLTDRAGRVFTRRLRELWKDRVIEVQFRVDAQFFDVLVRDEDTDALVALDERSRGFRWYFSFFVTFSADTLGGDKANAILLLDEPGLFLHAKAQGQLLQFFETLPNQLVYTTHSPFMIDPARLKAARTVNLETGTGTVVSADLSGDARTLFPLQAALGYDITQSLFVGKKNVVVEGVIDYWYLTAVSEYLRASGRSGLADDVVLTPAGGAQKVSYMVSLLAAQDLHVVVLLDAEPAARQARGDLVKAKLIRQESVILIVDAMTAPAPAEADVEDLLDPVTVQALAEEVYQKELSGRPLALNPNIPRIIPRLEEGFETLGIDFQKSRVARRFLDLIAANPTRVLAPAAENQFERLFSLMNTAVSRLDRAGREPFR